MTTIIGIAGSLRRGSFNRALLRAAAELAPEGCSLEIAPIGEIPLYDADREAEEGIPPAVAALKERIAAADGLLLASPEYNNSLPGVMKNAVDWLTRPPEDIPRVFGGLPVGLVGATPGQGGTRLVQAAWLPVLRALGTRLWTGRQLFVAGARDAFDAEGSLVDEKVRGLLERYMAGFAGFAAEARRAG